MHIVLAIAGLIIGSVLGRHGGWLYGMLAGFAIGSWIIANNKKKTPGRALYPKKHVYVDKDKIKEKETKQEQDITKTPSEPISVTKEVVESPIKETKPKEKKEPELVKTPAKEKPDYQPEPNIPEFAPAEPLPIDKAIAWLVAVRLGSLRLRMLAKLTSNSRMIF